MFTQIVSLFDQIDLLEIASAFIVLFTIIDVIGSTPVFIAIEQQGRTVNALKASLLSWAVLLLFFFAGDLLLELFHVDIRSFAVGGASIILLVALEMTLDVQIFHNRGPVKSATLVPVVFPLLAGAGAISALLALRADYHTINIMIGLALNMVWVYVCIRCVHWLKEHISDAFLYLLHKFFGIILLAISVRLITENLVPLIISIADK